MQWELGSRMIAMVGRRFFAKLIGALAVYNIWTVWIRIWRGTAFGRFQKKSNWVLPCNEVSQERLVISHGNNVLAFESILHHPTDTHVYCPCILQTC